VLAGVPARAHPNHGQGQFDKRSERMRVGATHLPPVQRNVELVGKVKVSGVKTGRVSDVGVHGRYAYLGDFEPANCNSRGVWIVDISDPRNPREVKYLKTGKGSYVGEGVQALALQTPKYTGDVLVISNEPCGDAAGTGGATLIDVSNPAAATPILSNFGDFDDVKPGEPRRANPSHSVFVWTDGPKAYAVVVDNHEGGDIFDISDPRKPVRIAEYDLPKMFPQILQKAPLNDLFFHDMIVKKINGRQIMVVSDWDAGYIKLDVTNPRKPTYLADSDFAAVDPELKKQRGVNLPAEGNAHESEFTADNQYIVAADEDFSPAQARLSYGGKSEVTGPAGMAFEGSYRATPIYAGEGCPSGAPVPPAPQDGGTYLAVVESGTCSFQAKHDAVVAAGGYKAIALAPGLACRYGSQLLTADRIPVLPLNDRAFAFGPFSYNTSGEKEPDCGAGAGPTLADLRPGTKGKQIELRGQFDGWGYVHLFANNTGKLTELDTWAIPEGMDPKYANGFGAMSVHETATSPTRPDLAYFAYYGGGFRVASVAGGKIREVGAFIDENGNDLWGVQVFQHAGQELVAASDMNYGLYLFRYTG
jgi:hypothetical protein